MMGNSFKSGLLAISSSDPGTDLSGWEITVSANLAEMTVSQPPKTEGTAAQDPKEAAAQKKAAAEAKRALDELKKTHEFLQPIPVDSATTPTNDASKAVLMKPGEYSIHRLFAAINCGSPKQSRTGLPLPSGC